MIICPKHGGVYYPARLEALGPFRFNSQGDYTLLNIDRSSGEEHYSTSLFKSSARELGVYFQVIAYRTGTEDKTPDHYILPVSYNLPIDFLSIVLRREKFEATFMNYKTHKLSSAEIIEFERGISEKIEEITPKSK